MALPSTPRFLLVEDWLGGQCGYSGIHQLARFLTDEPQVKIVRTADTRARRLLGKTYSLWRRWPNRNQSQTFTEIAAMWAAARGRLQTAHFLVAENHFPFLSTRGYRRPVIATMHMPASHFGSPLTQQGCVDTLILLTSQNRDYFAGVFGSRQSVFIRHGVNTEFFSPPTQPGPGPRPPSVLIVGRFLRDFQLTAETVLRLATRHPDWFFDFVVPATAWHSPELAAVRTLPGARWHNAVDDETLRRLYQESACHLAVFKDSTANNATVESLACGLPIVTTDRGGVRDYGAGTIYPLAPQGTAESLAAQCERYVSEPAWRAEIATASRRFAEQELAWPVIAKQHLKLYESVAETRRRTAVRP